MGHSKHLLRLSVSVSAWAIAASLACAQQAPGSPVPVTPTSPETVPTDTALTPDYQAPTSVSPSTTTTPGTITSKTTPGTTGSPSTVMGHPGEPMIDESTRLTFPNRPLLATGSTMFVLSYVPTVIFQAVDDRNKDLYIPVAGPWMDLAKGDDGGWAKALLGVSGALQGLGALGMVSSLFIPEKRTRNWRLLGNRRNAFNLGPARMSRTGYGVLAQGTF